MTPKQAYAKARIEGPSDLTRNAVLKDPRCTYWYAEDVDKCPRNDTRRAVLSEPLYAYWYSKDVDRCWRADTWKSSSTGRRSVQAPFEYSLEWLTSEDAPRNMVLI